ncbi:MAG: MFS transporter [Thermoplasmata archaeon]
MIESSGYKPRRSIGFLLAFSSFYLGLNYLWISYNSLILPIQVSILFPESERGLIVGAVAAGGVTLGVIMNILSGIISDQIHSVLGRRTPLILLGCMLLIPVMILIAVAPLTVILIASGYVFMQLFSNLAQGSFQPLLPDLITQSQRGEAGGFLGLFTLIGNALGYGITGLLVGLGYLSLSAFITIVPIILTMSIALYVIKNHDLPFSGTSKSLKKAFSNIFKPEEEAPGFFWLVMGSFFVLTGSSGLIYFELYFFDDVLKLPNPAFGVAISGLVVLFVGMVATIGLGSLSDKVGRKLILILAAVVGGIAMPILPFTKSFEFFLVVAAIVGATTGLFLSVEMAYASDLVPARASGQYMAYSNIAFGGSSAFAPIIDGSILYLFGSNMINAFIAMFFAASIFYFLGAILLLKTPKR